MSDKGSVKHSKVPPTAGAFASANGSPLVIDTQAGNLYFITDTSAIIKLSPFTNANVVAGLGYTPYNATNPSNYITAASAPVQSVAGRTGNVTLAVADVSGAAPLASPTFTGTIGLPGTGANQILAGTGDGASYTTYNTKLHLHNGLGIEDYTGTINGYYDARSGTWDVKGGFKINGVPVITGAGTSTRSQLLGVWDGNAFTGGGTNLSAATRSAVSAPNLYSQNMSLEFKNATAIPTAGNYGGLLTIAPWLGTAASTGDPNYQLLFTPTAVNSTAAPVLKLRAGIDTTWGAWATIWHSVNLVPSTTATGNSIVQRDASGYINGSYINMTDNSVGSGVSGIVCKAGDNYYRTATAAGTKAFLGITPADMNASAGQVMEIGRYIDFHGTTNANDYDVRLDCGATGANGAGTLTIGCSAVVSGGNVTANSDERLKTNWRDLPSDFIERFAEVKNGIYDRTDMPLTQVGVSAQSLQKPMPDAVIEDGKGLLSVNYGSAALVASVKLAQRSVEHSHEIAALINKLEQLTTRLEQLEKA